MNNILVKTLNNTKYLGFAIVISMFLYILLPMSYFLFHEEIYRVMQDKKLNSINIDTIQIKRREREIKEIEKRKKRKKTKIQKRFFNRFNLDLSMLAANGDGAGIMGAEYGNVIEEGEADVPPIKRIFIPPQYPRRAREEGIEAKIITKLLIDETGHVVTVRIVKEPRHWGFGTAVIEAAQKWKFEPAKLNNLPVKVWATQIIEFKL